ncbi:MAG TPA: 50S ribosomal protein L3 N(5)-glutamine methyltransferase [Burkholderiales bacterium]|nr:50S ribosomal protein L3 N(5)-glutamine methyltransferase [Burkholderiales bacterium]
MTVAALIRSGAARFAAARLAFGHGTSSAMDEAAYLVAHALSVPLERLPALAATQPSAAGATAVQRLFDRRIAERKPAAYLVREAWLGGRPFYVDERAIVPRSHVAELLRDDLAPWIAAPRGIRAALDLCSGSGCLAVLLAGCFPQARIDAADISHAALEVARINVRRYRLGKRIRVVRSDLFSALAGRRYDLIVSNPPYVTAPAMRRLPPEYRHEPRLALAAGADGLALVRRILRRARVHLNPGGLLVVEVGSGRARVERAFPRAGFVWPELTTGYPVFIATREQL